MVTIRVDGGNYQNYIGLDGRKRDTSLLLACDKKKMRESFCSVNLVLPCGMRVGAGSGCNRPYEKEASSGYAGRCFIAVSVSEAQVSLSGFDLLRI